MVINMYETVIPFTEKAKRIYLGQIKKQENEALFRKLEMTGAFGQESILNQMQMNDEIIEIGENELDNLLSNNLVLVVRKVHRYTMDVERRNQLIKEGNQKIRELIMNYDYSDGTHFHEKVNGFFEELLP